MSTNLTVNGVTFAFPATGENGWGTAVSSWASAVSSGTLQKSGGTFTLTADANFGATYGLLSNYFTSRTANPAAAGQVRLARADTVSWRNQANGADLPLGVDSSNNLEFNSVDIATATNTLTLTNKTVTNLKDDTRAYARATRSTTQTISNNTETVVGFNTTVLDTRTGISGTDTTWKYTVPAGHAGIYQVTANVALNGNGAVAGVAYTSLFKNNVKYSLLSYCEVAGISDTAYMAGSDIISLAAADYITVKVFHSQNSGSATRDVNANAYDNHISIVRLVTDL